MQVVFDRPLFLYLLLILPVFYYIYYRSSIYTRNKKSVVIVGLRLLMITCLVLALARPQFFLPEKKQTIIFAVDLSESMNEFRDDVRDFIREALTHKKNNDKVGIITFGKEAVMEKPIDIEYPFSDFETEPQPDFTNIESALNMARKHISQYKAARVVLLSDGEENLGSIRTIISSFKKKGIPVDIKSFAREPTSEIQINKVLVPERIRSGQNFQIKVSIEANNKASGELRLYHNNNLIKTDDIILKQGKNLFTYQQSLSDSGFHNYRVEITGEPDTVKRNNTGSGFVVVTGQKRLLLISDLGKEVEQLISSLDKHNISVELRSPVSFPESLKKLQSYAAVMLNNVSVSYLSHREMEMLQTFVEDGGGLIVIGGDSSLGADNYTDTELDDLLPVTTVLEQEAYTPSLALVLIIDKSGSMGDERGSSSKIEIGKIAARATTEILLEREKIGIIAFDTEADIVLPVQKAVNMTEIFDKIESIKSEGGGTNIYPALKTAYDILDEEKTAAKHIILISDGITKSGEFEEITKEISASGISLSTIAIGDDAHLELMARLANWGEGKSYYTTDISSIPRILTTETDRVTPSAIVEGEIEVIPVNKDILLSRSINWEQAPSLHGFIKTTPRSVADVYLQAPDKSPILAGWRYGLGRTLVFTSDLGKSWAREWLQWDGYHKFWPEVVNWVLPEDNNNIFTSISVAGDRGQLVVSAVAENGKLLNFRNYEARIQKPSGEVQQRKLSQTGSGRYKTDFAIGNPGTYMVNVIQKEEEKETAVTTGITVPYSPEFKFSFSNTDHQLLLNIANYTGGRILNSPEEVYQDPPVTYSNSYDLSSYLIILALIIFMIDIATRTVSWQSVKSIFS